MSNQTLRSIPLPSVTTRSSFVLAGICVILACGMWAGAEAGIPLYAQDLIFPRFSGDRDKVVYSTSGGLPDGAEEAYRLSPRVQA